MADDEDKQNEMLDDITEKIANSASMVPPPSSPTSGARAHHCRKSEVIFLHK